MSFFSKIIGLWLVSCILVAASFAETEFSTCLYDLERSRPIPVTVYQPKHVEKGTSVIIFNHGYDGNKNPESNRSYSYLTRFLAENGYYVISIQHELPGDTPLAMKGNFMDTRMPNWKRGEENILFTIKQFQQLKPDLNWKRLAMIGHSNGGDMTMLVATNHPQLLEKAISLDHRRMIVPRETHVSIYTLRSCDCEADTGVLPGMGERAKNKIEVINLEGISHSDMGDRGTESQHRIINKHIIRFLKE